MRSKEERKIIMFFLKECESMITPDKITNSNSEYTAAVLRAVLQFERRIANEK